MSAKQSNGAGKAFGWIVALLVGVAAWSGLTSKSSTAPSRCSNPSSYSYSQGKPSVAENGSRYGAISERTGRPKTVHVNGYYRKDGTYVRGHYRSKPR